MVAWHCNKERKKGYILTLFFVHDCIARVFKRIIKVNHHFNLESENKAHTPVHGAYAQPGLGEHLGLTDREGGV